MHIDPRALFLLIFLAGTATVLGLSYVAVFQLGRSKGRKEAEQEALERQSTSGDAYAHARLDQVERSIAAMASTVKRLGDAQRIWVDYQDRAGRRERGEISRRTPA